MRRPALSPTVSIVLAAAFLAPGAALGAEAQGFPAKTSGAAAYSSPAVADLDGDGELEIAFVAGGLLDVWKADGTMAAGFPIVLKEKSEIQSSPAIGDLLGDGKMEVVVGSSHGVLFAFSARGEPLPGFPKTLGAGKVGTPTLFDIDGDKKMEILVGTTEGKIHCLKATGGTCKGFPVDAGAEVTANPAMGYFGPDRKLCVAAGTADGKVRVWEAAGGREVDGFPVVSHYRISGPPAFVDINDDGFNEIVFASQDYKLYAVDHHGKSLAGFPYATDYRIHGAPAFGDLDGDGRLDVVTGSADGSVYAVTWQGKPLKGFPVKTGNRIFASPAVGDIDGDGLAEIVIPSTDGKLYVLRGDGTAFPGFPEDLGGEITSSPFVGDVNKDGKIEIVVATPRSDLHAIKINTPADKKARITWPTLGHDSQRTSRLYPTPARFGDVKIDPAKPLAGDVLTVKYLYTHLDGDPEANTQVRWYRDGKVVTDYNNKKDIPPKATKKHEKWLVALQEGKNFEEYAEKTGARIYRSGETEIRNIPPEAPKVVIEPAAPRFGDKLQVKITQPSTDADGDTVAYRYFWLRNHQPVKLPKEQDFIDAKVIRKGEKWSVVVTPIDGEETGKTGEAEAKVGNTPPGAPEVKVEPDSPRVTDKITVKTVKAAPDVDNDTISYRYQWTVNGKPVNFPPDADVLAPGMIAKNRAFTVTVTPFDGDQDGTPVKAEGRTVNTPPDKPEVAVGPAKPTVLDGIAARIKKESADVDGDAVGYSFAWYRNGDLQKGQNGATVPGKEIKKGETWKVSAIPSDGEKDGAAGEATITVVNAAPTRIEADLSAAEPKAGEGVEVKITKQPADPDGDKLNLRYHWYRNGKEVAALADKPAVSASEIGKNQTWKVEMWADDGETSGPGNVRYFYTRNTPPTRPAISVRNKAPRAGEGIAVTVDKPSTDADGDKIAYRYRWYRFGQEMEAFKDRTELKPADIKKGDTWTVAVAAHDGEVEGDKASETITVTNTKPEAGEVEITPKSPGKLDKPVCKVTRKPSDPDGDSLRTWIKWQINGKPAAAGGETDSLAPGSFSSGDRLKCEIAVSDGEVETVANSAEVTVVNTPPGAPGVAITPVKPLNGKPITCIIAKTSGDADGDDVTYAYSWEKNGKDAGVSVSTVDGKMVVRGDVWKCSVTPSDGKTQGRGGSAETKVLNSPPGAAKVRVTPQTPPAGQPLKCEVYGPAPDPDGDKVTYKYFWFKDGSPQNYATTAAELPGKGVKEGDIWSCEVVPTDGREEGERTGSVGVLVGPKK